MGNNYSSALRELGLDALIALRAGEDKDRLLTEYIPKAIFYSRDDNSHDRSIAELIVGNSLDDKEGWLPDVIQFLRLYRVKEGLTSLAGKEVRAKDIIDIRERLIADLFSNGKHSPEIRRYRLSNGPRIAIRQSELMEKLDLALNYLNHNPESVTDAFLNGIRFYAEFINLHPFEDANGRTGRMFYNWNAIRNGIRPIHVSRETKEAHLEFMHPYFLTNGNMGSAIALTLFLSFGKEHLEELAKLVNSSRGSTSAYTLDLKCNLSLLLQKGNRVQGPAREQLAKDIQYIYEVGSAAKDKNLVTSSLWLLSYASMDNPEILKKSYIDGSTEVRTMAVFAMSKINYAKYGSMIRSKLLDSGEKPEVRSQAVVQCGYNGDLDPRTAMEVFESASDETLLISLGKFYTYTKRLSGDPKALELPNKLMASNNEELRLRGYQALIVHGSDNEILEVLRRELASLSEVIKKEIVVELRRTGKFASPEIAEEISKTAISDPGVRRPLLGELVLSNDNCASYVNFLDKILESNDYSEGERAHAIYALYKTTGAYYVNENHIKPGHVNTQSKLERIATMSVMVRLYADPARTYVDERFKELINSMRYKERVVFALEAQRILRDQPNAANVVRLRQDGEGLPTLDSLKQTYEGLGRASVFKEILRVLDDPSAVVVGRRKGTVRNP